MQSNPCDEYLKSFDLSSFQLDGYNLLDLIEAPPYFAEMISDFKFYFININTSKSIILEIDEMMSDKCVRFSTFSFNSYEKFEFFILCFERYCFIFNISNKDNLNYINQMLIYLTKCKIHLIAPNLESYDKFNLFINEFGNSQFFNSKIIFPSEKEKEIIQYEMNEFNQHLPKKLSQHPILKISAFCVSTFMIRRFYYKSQYFDLDFFQYSKYKDKLNENRIILQEFKKDEFIILRDISSNTSLAFHKKTNHLVVLKYKQIFINKEEFQKEIEFYNKINEIKGIVKCFGYITNDGNEVKALIFEFMENGTLQNFINKKKKSYNYLFSFQIIETLNELHLNNIIHRDLKPDNIFINHDLNVYIGDFDCSRIFSNSMNLTHSLTKDIGFIYASPEMINSQQYTKSTDIYSFGLVLYFIYMKEHPYQVTNDIDIIDIKNEKKIHHFKQKFEDEFIQNIYLKCIKLNPNERPKSNDIVNYFIDISFSTIHTDQIKLLLYLLINENLYIRDRILSIYKQKYNEEIQPLNTLYILYLLLIANYGKINEFNMRKTRKYLTNLALKGNPSAYFIFGENCFHKITPLVSEGIHYYELAANQNIIQAQLTLSKLYSKGKYVPRDMNKSHHYLKLAADLNSLTAQIILGQYFYDRRHIDKNIKKSIHYYTLAAKQNDADALVMLGKIYFDNENIPRDVDKAIHFFQLAADLNDQYAQLMLGKIYYVNNYVKQDLKKSIYYLTLSANQNYFKAQYFLGIAYISGEYIERDVNKAIYYFTLSANQNYSEAQYQLALYYYQNRYKENNAVKCIHYFKLAADQNHICAQIELGLIYYYGEIVGRDMSNCIHYITLASVKNNPLVHYCLGCIYFEIRDIKKSMHHLKMAAKQNYLESNFYIGILYYKRNSKPNDINKAIHYFTLSANQNNSDAQNILGYLYLYVIKPIDANKAIHYYNLSVKQNNKYALYNLGLIYFDGKYVVRDIDRAIYYLTLSANQGVDFSQYFLGFIYSNKEFKSYNINKAIHYFTLSANQCNKKSQFNIGFIYLNGEGVQQDIDKAIHYLELSANKKYKKALFTLGNIYFYGCFVKKDVNKGIEYLKICAQKNEYRSNMFLGKIYYYGDNVQQDIDKAIHYLTISTELEHSEAQTILGEIYFSNQFVPRDIKKAIYYFKESSNINDSIAKNYLGIIYKNGFGVSKNIFHAIEYFDEAIRQKNENFAFYNLSRIYYFGIDVDKKIVKAIELLEISSNSKFLPATIFLFFIYKFGDEKIKNLEKEKDYELRLYNCDLNEKDKNKLFLLSFNERIFEFFKKFDLAPYNEKFYINHFFHFIQNGKFCKQSQNIQSKNKAQKDINKYFYEGFGSNF